MNVWKKISALTFVLALALALSVSAFASNSESFPGGTTEAPTPGKIGSADGTSTEPIALNRIINLQKDLVVYNATNHVTQEGGADGQVFAPGFTYTYTVTAADVATSLSVTDEYGTIAPVKAGIIPGLTVNDGTQAASNAAQATGTLEYTTDMTLKADSNGAVNTRPIALDFTNVQFKNNDVFQPGVYRYKIEETLTSTTTQGAYSTLSMTDGTMNVVYLDVYVKGDGAIYGYVCLPGNTSISANSAPAPTKINGFVQSAGGADSYYTYDLKLSKTVTGDNYAQATHAFPFSVIFTKTSGLDTNAQFKIYEAITQANNDTSNATTGLSNTYTSAASAATNNGWFGVAHIKSGASITYCGIPCGMQAEVYETNDMSGVTYKVTTKLDDVVSKVGSGSTQTDDETVTPAAATAVPAGTTQETKEDYQSTAVKIAPAVATVVTIQKTCEIINALVNISPTGVTLRYAPYLLTLGAGITVLPLSRRYKKREEEI